MAAFGAAVQDHVAPQPVSSGANELTRRDVAGLHFAPTHLLDGQQLVLNGAGVRAKMIIKVYAMGLYLPWPEADAQANAVRERVMARSQDLMRHGDASYRGETLALDYLPNLGTRVTLLGAQP